MVMIALQACAPPAAPGDVPMQITLTTQGGIASFPGLQRPVTVSLDQLAPDMQTELRKLIDACDFFNLPEHLDPPARGAADYRTYVITVQAPQRTHTVTLTDPVKDARMQRLIQLVRDMQRAK
jgi:emfourin